MEKSFFFNAVVTNGVPDRSYSAEDIAQREACLISDGVIGTDSLSVEGMSASGVYVSPGAASVSGYTYINTGTLYLNMDAGDTSYSRIDTVALKLDLDGRNISAAVFKGTPAANPAAPDLTNTSSVKYLPLADVLVSPGASSVETEDITDRRALAGYGSVKDEMLMVLREYLGALDPVNSQEAAKIRKVISIVNDSSGEDKVLCGDGVYRQIPTLKREVAKEYTTPGMDNFVPSMYPSEGGLYDIEVQGAGGAGGSYIGAEARGGGGGGGAYLMASQVKIRRQLCTVVVGEGGAGVPGGAGEDGGYSAFDGFIAEGGSGGGGGSSAAGGTGGKGMFCGHDGMDGTSAADGKIYSYCGKGGFSQYGNGASSPLGDGSIQGNDAEYPGAGGSGGTSVAGTVGKAGGSGGDGRVVIYRYVKTGSEEDQG